MEMQNKKQIIVGKKGLNIREYLHYRVADTTAPLKDDDQFFVGLSENCERSFRKPIFPYELIYGFGFFEPVVCSVSLLWTLLKIKNPKKIPNLIGILPILEMAISIRYYGTFHRVSQSEKWGYLSSNEEYILEDHLLKFAELRGIKKSLIELATTEMIYPKGENQALMLNVTIETVNEIKNAIIRYKRHLRAHSHQAHQNKELKVAA
jgi:hypothetical protein